MTDIDLTFATIEELARLFRKRKLSPVELTRLMLDRTNQLNPKVNAYITVTPELALAQAKKAEAELFAPRGGKGRRDRGPLHGIPISLKDNIYTKGIRTTAGSKILKDFIPEHDAEVWARLQQAGAIMLGKTNMHEFAYGVTNNNPHYGPARNPWDLSRIAGGSSGGSAAAVAAGLCYGSIGTDTGGSIRVPAALCGVVGLKPGIGRVSGEGVIPLSARLDFVGTLARTAQGAALLFDAIIARQKNESRRSSLENTHVKLRKLTIGLPEFAFDIVSKEVLGAFHETLRALEKKRVKTREVSIPLLNETENAGNEIAWAEATRYHEQAGWFPARSAEYGDDVRTRLEMGTKVSATAYLRALEIREKFIQQLHSAMDEADVDALALPTTPIAAPLIGEEASAIGGTNYPTRALLLRLNRPANLAGLPAISIPCGFTANGLPIGFQLVGRKGDEQILLHIASMVEGVYPLVRHPIL
jgi:aspartyl-tRNA(Asn)/glutamyl-tRNA(Gln) amidotransferase subunit A